MATLRQYFDNDFPNLSVDRSVRLRGPGFEEEISLKILMDFNSNTKYLSLYIPCNSSYLDICKRILRNLDRLLAIDDRVEIKTGLPGERLISSKNLAFSGRVFIYSENNASESEIDELDQFAKQQKLHIQYRGPEFAKERTAMENPEKPLAFISYDSRDKESIARPLATELFNRMCPVWFDEFSLKIGDNLRESIERGIKECKRCILILSKNFLSNDGWAKTEFDSVFTKELIEKQNVILPIWVDVSEKEVCKYSPSLANKVAIKWDIRNRESSK